MKPRKITYEQSRQIYGSMGHEAYTDGWNAAIEAMEQHRKEKKAKRDKMERVDQSTCPMYDLIGEAHNRISKIGSRLFHTETYCIDEEIKKLHSKLDSFLKNQNVTNSVYLEYISGHNDRLNNIEAQIGIIHAGNTHWQKKVITTGSAVDLKGIGSTIISHSK